MKKRATPKRRRPKTPNRTPRSGRKRSKTPGKSKSSRSKSQTPKKRSKQDKRSASILKKRKKFLHSFVQQKQDFNDLSHENERKLAIQKRDAKNLAVESL